MALAAGAKLGTGYVSVEPDFSGFQEKLGKRLNQALTPAFQRAGRNAGKELAGGLGRGGLAQALSPLLKRFEKFGDDAGRTIASRIGKGSQRAAGDMFGLADAVREVEEQSRRARGGVKPLETDMFGIGRAARESGKRLRSAKTELRDWHARVEASKGGVRRLSERLKGLGGDLLKTGRGLRVTSSGFGGFDGIMARVNRGFSFFRNIIRTLKWPTLIAGVGLALQGLSALAAAAVATTAALSPLAGALVALPSAALVAAQAFGVLKLATAGVGDTIKAALSAEEQGGQQAVDVMRQQESAAEQVADAKRNLASVQRDATLAQEDLTRAREDAVRALQDMRLEADRSRDSEQQGALQLTQARKELAKTLRDPNATGLDVRFAEEAVDQARNDLKQTRLDAQRAREDYRKAQKAGVDGMPEVVAAKRAEEDATRSVADAERDLQKAVKDSTEAMKDQGSAATAFQEKMAQLPPAAQKFVRVLLSLKPRLDELRATAASGFFPGAEVGLKGLMGNFKEIKGVVAGTAGALGKLAAKAGKKLGSDVWGKDLTRLGKLNTRILGRMGDAGLNLADSFRHILVSAEPFLDWLSESTKEFSGWIKSESEAGRKSGALSEFFDRTRETMERLGPILKGVGGGLLNVGEAARPLGNEILDALGSSAEGWRKWTDSIRGKNELRQYFADSKPAIFEVGRLLRDATKAFFDLGTQPGVAKVLKLVRTKLLPVLTELVGTMTDAFGEALVSALTNMARLFGEIAQANGPLVLFVRTIGAMAGAVADLLKNNPALHTLVTGLVGFFAIVKAASFVGAITGFRKLSESILATSSAYRSLATGQAFSEVASKQGVMATSFARVGRTGAGRLAMSFGRFLGPALAALGLANIITSATQGDWKDAGIQVGGALVGGVAGLLIGKSPMAASLGAGLGSMLGGALSGLLSSSKQLTPVQKQLRDMAQHSAKAMRDQAGAADALVAAQGRLKAANQRQKAASHAVTEAQRKYTGAVRKFGPESLPALKAALALSRAQHREARAAEEAKKAHRLSGIELELFKNRTVRAYAAERQRIPILDQTVERLTKRWRSEKNNLPLQERLEKRVRELSKAEQIRDRLLEEGAQKVGPKWARALQHMSGAQAQFGTHFKGLLRQLPEFGKKTQESIQKATNGWVDYRGTVTSQSAGAKEQTQRFAKVSSTAFTGLAELVREADENIGANTSRLLRSLGAGKIPSFKLQKMEGQEAVGRQEGGLVPAFAAGGLASVVPGQSTGDRHTLSLNGRPVAKVESKEGIFVGNRNLMGALQQANAAVPRFQEGGFVGRLRRGGLAEPQIAGQDGPLRDLGQKAIQKVFKGAKDFLDKHSPAFGGMTGSGDVESVFAKVAKRLSRSKIATLALGMAGFTESRMRDLPFGDSSSEGALQLLKSTAASMGIDPHDEGAVASAFLLRGFFGRGGANALAAQGLPAHLVAQGAQGSAFSDGSNYLAQEGPAKAWMKRFGLQAGGLVKGLAQGGPIGATIRRLAAGGMVDPSWDTGGETIAGSIAQLVAAYAKRFDIDITAGYDPDGGHVSSGHNTTGTATDVVPRDGNWDGAFAKGLETLTGMGFEVGYDGSIPGTQDWENHGRGNHAHIEWVGNGTAPDARQRLREFLGGAGSASDASAPAAPKEDIPDPYRGARTGPLNLGPMPKTPEGVKKEIERWQSGIGTYLKAKRYAEKHNRPEVAQKIGRNVEVIEGRLSGLRSLRTRLRLQATKKALSKRLGKGRKQFGGYEQWIEGAQRDYERANQDTQQLVELEPQDPELPANATDGQREAAEKAYVKNFSDYVNTRERPAYAGVLDRVAHWRNTILRAEMYGFGKDRPSVAGMETRWEGEDRKVTSSIDHIKEFSKKVGERLAVFKSKNPKDALPTWLQKQVNERTAMLKDLPRLQLKDTELRKVIGEAREKFFPGGENRLKPNAAGIPVLPLAGSGSLEESLKEVQGIHWPDLHELLSASGIAPPRIAGRFGGAIWDVQGAIEELGLNITRATNSLAGGSSETDDSESKAFSEEQSRQANQRADVSDTQKVTLENWDKMRQGLFSKLPKFHTGGTVGGPAGQETPIMALGKERIRTPEKELEMATAIRGLAGGQGEPQVIINGNIVQEPGDTRDPVEVVLNDRRFAPAVQQHARVGRGVGLKTPGGTRR